MISESRDATGKGRTIKRIIKRLNLKGARIVTLEKSDDKKKARVNVIKHINMAGE